MGLAPRTITVTPEVVPYWGYRQGPLRGWLIFFAIVAFVLAWLDRPFWAAVALDTAIGVLLVVLALWVHFTSPIVARESSAPRPTEYRRRRMLAPKWIAVLFAVGIALVLLGLTTYPLEHSYSAIIPSSFYEKQNSGWELRFPGAEQVTGAWGTSNGQPVLVEMTPVSSASVVYQGNESSGGFQFTQTAVLVFVIAPANSTANVVIVGNYWSPYWIV